MLKSKKTSLHKYGRFISDYTNFLRELPDSFSEIGAMLPSSPHLAKLMVEPLNVVERAPWAILEIGPGTGPFTRSILKAMGPEDTLQICEINSRFMEVLKKSLLNNADYQRNKDRISFYEGSILDLAEGIDPESYDFIVSSLPFHNFPVDLVRQFLAVYSKVLKPDGILSFFHYAGLRKLSGISPSKTVRDRIKQVDTLLRDWCQDHAKDGSFKKRVSFLNVPPAVSVRFSIQSKGS
jgi:phosphatidylethanolamine/phosphatidyl-N-methylethanolamine N-methyltransferase